jgi:hypothetical protein
VAFLTILANSSADAAIHDLVVIAMQDQRGNVDLFEILG